MQPIGVHYCEDGGRNKIISANNIINTMAIVMSGNSNILAHIIGRQMSMKFNKFTI